MLNMEHRYLLFTGDHYYPCGGWGDYRDSYETIPAAHAAMLLMTDEWYQIVDLQSRSTGSSVVEKGSIQAAQASEKQAPRAQRIRHTSWSDTDEFVQTTED